MSEIIFIILRHLEKCAGIGMDQSDVYWTPKIWIYQRGPYIALHCHNECSHLSKNNVNYIQYNCTKNIRSIHEEKEDDSFFLPIISKFQKWSDQMFLLILLKVFVFLREIQMCGDHRAHLVTGRERDQGRVQQTGQGQQRIHHERWENNLFC